MIREKHSTYDPLAGSTSASRRKCLLFAVPVLQADFQLIEQDIRYTASDPGARELFRQLLSLHETIGVIERAADDEANFDEEAKVHEDFTIGKENAVLDQDFAIAAYFRDVAAILARTTQPGSTLPPPYLQTARHLRRGGLAGYILSHGATPNSPRARKEQEAIEAQRARYNDYLAEVFGSAPSVTFNPDWRTDTTLSLARTIYESRDFSAMPILADALQDSGCGDDDILTHCRDAKQGHVRGCWVVDLVLDKE